jgi:hypothetical protein
MKDLATIIGARIAGRPVYTPGYTVAGIDKPRSAKIEFNVFKNKGEKKLVHKVTAWGGMADAIARGGAVGKKISFNAEIIPFQGRVYQRQADGTNKIMLNADGTELKTWKTGYTIMDMDWGRDSAKTIANEIATGMRPAGWNTPGDPGQVAWSQICANRNASHFVPGSPVFEYADVDVRYIPQGAQFLAPKVANNMAQTYTAPAPVYQAAQSNPAQQVMVNGQSMGYAMPAANPTLPTHDANGQLIQYASNPGAVAQALPANTGYAQPVNPVQPIQQPQYAQPVQQVAQPGAYGSVVM